MISAHVTKAPPGIGKTTAAVRKIALKMRGKSEIYVPTHDLAEEIRQLFHQMNPRLSVRIVRGRGRAGPNGQPMCARQQAAEEVARSGLDVYSSMCERPVGKRIERCSYFATCPYIQQFFGDAEVTIYTHAQLSKERTKLEPAIPDRVVIDETFWLSCIEIVDVPVGLLHAPFLQEARLAAANRVCTAVYDALMRRAPLFDSLRSQGIYESDIRDARIRLRSVRGAPKPGMNDSELRAAARTLRDQFLVRILMDCLWEEIHTDRPDSHAIVLDRAKGVVRVHMLSRIRRFDDPEGIKNVPVLVIDGSADERIIKRFMHVGTFQVIPAARNARAVQCSSTRCSTISLDPARNPSENGRKAARKRMKQLTSFIERLAAEHKRVLVVGPKAITGNPRTGKTPLLRVPSNVDLAHFGAIRGIDRWKNHDAIVVIGRNEPPIAEVEKLARALWLSHHEPLRCGADWVTEVRGYRTAGTRLGVDVVRHPDDRVQAVLEQIREAESVQAIDRLRLVHNVQAKNVYLLSNIPLDVDVHELVDWDDLMEGRRVEQAFKQMSGTMPLAPTWLAQRFPRLWRTVAAAEKDIARWRKGRHCSNRSSIGKTSVFAHEYRPAASGQRAWSWCLSTFKNAADAGAGLEVLLGQSIVMGRAEVAPPTTPASPRVRRTRSSSTSPQSCRHRPRRQPAARRPTSG